MAAEGAQDSDTCILCNMSETNEITGGLQRTPDGRVVAHYNCMLYSPPVTMTNSQEAVEGFDFDIKSVLDEIRRGRFLRCNMCKKRGATIGCDVKSCKRKYHYPCVIKAKGTPSQDGYVVHCFEHRTDKTANGPKDTPRGRKRKRFQKTDDKQRKNNVKRRHHNNNNAIEEDEDSTEDEEEIPSTSGQQNFNGESHESHACTATYPPVTAAAPIRPTTSSDTSSEESDSILSPKVKEVFSLSGFPKNKAKYSSNRKPNEKLQEVLQTLSSQDQANLSQIYSELGGSHHLTLEMVSSQDHQNDAMTTEDALSGDVTDIATSSDSDDTDKTPESLPGNNGHDSPSKFSPEEQYVTEEQPASSGDEEIPDKTSASSSKRKNRTLDDVLSKLSSRLPTPPSYSNIEDRPCMSTRDASSSSDDITDKPDSQSSEFSNDTIGLILQSMTPITGNSAAQAVGSSNDIWPPTQQILSTNSKERLSSQPTHCTDASKSIRPDTSVGCSSDSFNEQPANDLIVEGTSETHPSGCPSVIEHESSLCSPLEEDGNKTEVSTSVSDVSWKNMENDVLASQTFNREILPVASPSNGGTLQNEKGQKRGTISNIVSPEQITALSRNLRTGILTERLKSMVKDVPKILRTINSPKRNATIDAEKRRNDDSIKEMDPVSQERSESITPKRKRSEDSEELLPNITPQLTERNLPEQLEIPEEQDEYNCRENATPGSVESERAVEHQSGPSRMTTPRRRGHSSLLRNGRRSGFQRERVGDLDGIEGFGRAVAGQCRSMPQDRQAKYMSYVLAAADLFHALPTLPDTDILLNNLQTVLARSQQSSPSSVWGSPI